MKNRYLTLFFVAFTLFAAPKIMAQNNTHISPVENKIEGLNIYPNPVNITAPFLTIKSALNANKTIEFYNVLGKRIFVTILRGKQLNIAHLSPGVYILKITENHISEARKLIIR